MVTNNNNQTNLHNSSRRGKKQKQQTTTISTKEGNLVIDAKYKTEAIATIRKLDRAKRRVSLFNKIAVLVAFVCVGNNIYSILSNRHRKKYGDSNGGFFIVMSEAFQSINVKLLQRSNIKEWSLFGSSTATAKSYVIPRDTLQSFGSYPNRLNITESMRSEYHPIVKLPVRKMKKGDVKVSENDGTCFEGSDQTNKKFWPFNRKKNQPSTCIPSNQQMNETFDYIVQDFTRQKRDDNKVSLEGGKKVPQLLSSKEEAIEYAKHQKASKRYDVGRYDEDRRGMYTSDLFGSDDDDSSSSSRRTVHVGLDIGAPVNTNVYSFTEGKIHSVGYNSDLGDYGHVIVIAHTLQNGKIVYALYGHLSKKSIVGKFVGQSIKRGQLIGSLGNTAENGGWTGKSYTYLFDPSNRFIS